MTKKINLEKKDIISVRDLSKQEILYIMELAERIGKNPKKYSKLLDGHVLATLFYEPSTRTMMSFQAAISRLGGRFIGFSDPKVTSVKKGESLHDTIKMFERYSDAIVIRHPNEGSARYAAEVSDVPIINCGDGANQHPTQTLLDIYSILRCQGELNNLKVAFVGDLKYGRTVHSLALGLSHFGCELFFVSPKTLPMPYSILEELYDCGVCYTVHEKMEDVIEDVDVVYMTRIQKERFYDISDYEKVKNAYTIERSMLTHVKKNLKILHPLPRVNEINRDIDDTKYQFYFEQAAYGMLIRQALLGALLGRLR